MADESDKELKLRVAKAIPSDVGHGRARVPFDNELNLKPGDIIEIEGERSTAAIVWLSTLCTNRMSILFMGTG